MYAANENIECDVYIPAGQIAPGKLSQAYQFGAQIIQVEGNFDDAFAKSLEDAKKLGGYTVNSINPFRIEGQKTIPYRVLENLNWEPPDWIVYPGGALGNTASCGKCLMELYKWGWIKKIPRIVVVNAEGANTLYELYNGKFEETELRWNKGTPNIELIQRYYNHLDKKGIRPKTKATAIQIGRPSNILKGLRALEFTNGIVTEVSDSEMLDGMSIVGLNGFDCEMASGSVPAGIRKLIKEEIIQNDDTVVGILTGRQKDAMLPVEYHNDVSNRFAKPPKR
jgi:threonine synthase